MIRGGVRRFFQLPIRRRDRWEQDVEDEIKLHLALRAEELANRGAPLDEAYREAVRKFGPLAESRARMLDAARHREQRMQRAEYLSDLRQDLSFAFRTLRRDKGWTTVTVLTLGLGIGAATAVFSAVSSLLLHPVSYPGANRVVLIYQQPALGNNTGINVEVSTSAWELRAWRAAAHSFEALEPMWAVDARMRTTGDPVDLHAVRIEPSFPTFAGVRPLIGRMFTPAEVASGGREVVLGEGLWRARFGADPDVVGKTITLDDSIYSIVGVMPSRLRTPLARDPVIDAWLPLDLSRDDKFLSIVGRLRPGVDLAHARAELDTIYARQAAARGEKANFRTAVVSPASRAEFHDSLILLAYAVGLVLLVACANVAHLLLARSAARRRELAIRAALGAGRSRVFRQLLTESLLLAITGGLLGVGGGWLGLRAIVAARPPALPALQVAHVDATTLVLALAVTIASSVAFGVLGAVHAARQSTHDALKSGTRGAGGGRSGLRRFIVVTEMALSATLVVGASMLVRSVIKMQHADLGYEPEGLYTIRPVAAPSHFANTAVRGRLLRELATRISAIPGVQGVSLVSSPPGWWYFSIGRLEIDGRPAPPATATQFVHVNWIQHGYFDTMRQRLVEGTAFTDTTPAAHQVIVNEAFARKQWGASALGKRLRVAQSGKEPWLTVVGVAAEAATSGPSASESTEPLLYAPAADSNTIALLVRTAGSADVLSSVPALVRSIDPLATAKVESALDTVAASISEPRFVMMLLTLFTALALALAAIGLYGVMAYTVAQRTREIGIRVALGAPSGRIARAVISGGVVLAIAGAAIGLGIAAWGTKLIASQLYGVSRSDPASFAVAAIVLVGAAVLACVVPTRRALAVDPMTAIRAE